MPTNGNGFSTRTSASLSPTVAPSTEVPTVETTQPTSFPTPSYYIEVAKPTSVPTPGYSSDSTDSPSLDVPTSFPTIGTFIYVAKPTSMPSNSVPTKMFARKAATKSRKYKRIMNRFN